MQKNCQKPKPSQTSNKNVPRELNNSTLERIFWNTLPSSDANDSLYKFVLAINTRLVTPSKITKHLGVHKRIVIIFVHHKFP